MKTDESGSKRSRPRSESTSSSDTAVRRSRSKHKSRSGSRPRSAGAGERERRHSDSSAHSEDKTKDDKKSRRRRNKKKHQGSRSAVIEIGRLTSAVSKEHVLEIFSQYGRIRSLEIAPDHTIQPVGPARALGHFQRASVEYESRADATRAKKYGNGGMIDRQEITVEIVSTRPSRRR